MVTFIILCTLVAFAIAIVVIGVAIAATLFSGVALVIADVCIGILPFWLVIQLIRWLLRKKG